ncbi:iron chaperone [Paractinoplanes durhamensis]|uniref:YdhG-like domain-containing protein n=1 Tax=Paractinoplanes durhamensis TaxID=113563 RepID=A0ABQ3YU13_9ACTN|nr:DUF1801 domain-containing protein [Actinoplanes durhamensis]GIE01082.1 hypothetical protein Adu01nite_24320 [Actinoplanes durhamensis]
MATKKFTDEERAAMKERAKELKKGPDTEADVLAKIAEMTGTDRELAERVHAVIKDNAPEITPKLWYGMPAYARNGKVVCHFQPAAKFKTRFATLTFSDQSNLDDGAMWPVSFALTELTPDAESRIAALVKQAMS